MKTARLNFLKSMVQTTLECGIKNDPKKHADISTSLVLTFEAIVRQDQKEKCAASIQDDIGEDLFLIQRIMEAD